MFQFVDIVKISELSLQNVLSIALSAFSVSFAHNVLIDMSIWKEVVLVARLTAGLASQQIILAEVVDQVTIDS